MRITNIDYEYRNVFLSIPFWNAPYSLADIRAIDLLVVSNNA